MFGKGLTEHAQASRSLVHAPSTLPGLKKHGTFNQRLKRPHIKLNAQNLIDLDTWCIESTVVKATRVSSRAGQKGGATTSDHALGRRTKGGLTMNIDCSR